ncbi:MAG: glycosyltransferase family 4 protein [Bryobacteraceae bacterium]|nr:glycosyltransferase family 4 protein [Bryobacteraceae bacterium]
MHWILITGAYPPDAGGLADYTAVLARELARTGDRVTVITGPLPMSALPVTPGVELVTLKNHFGQRGLVDLDQFLRTVKGPHQLVVQYVPQALGPRKRSRFKGLPLSFTRWLQRRAAAGAPPVWTMFHEAKILAPPGAGLALKGLSFATDRMLGWTARASSRIFVAMSAWEPHIRQHIPASQPVEYLPIPSNVATVVDLAARAETRAALLNGHARSVVGHFGTFSSEVLDLVEPFVRRSLQEHPDRQILLVGDGSREFALRLGPTPNLTATGRMESSDVARHLSACDLMVQPFPDGASTRRGSIMAGLALGVPVVSNTGSASESIWRDAQAVALADDPAALEAVVDPLLAHPEQLQALGARGRSLYEQRFSLNHTLQVLRVAAPIG